MDETTISVGSQVDMTGLEWDALTDLLVADRVQLPNQVLLHLVHIPCYGSHVMSRGLLRYAGIVSAQVAKQPLSYVTFADIDPHALLEQAIASIGAWYERFDARLGELTRHLFWKWHC